jgi:hypothetical protein
MTKSLTLRFLFLVLVSLFCPAFLAWAGELELEYDLDKADIIINRGNAEPVQLRHSPTLRLPIGVVEQYGNMGLSEQIMSRQCQNDRHTPIDDDYNFPPTEI